MSKKQEAKLNYKQRSGISFIEQDDPAFIKQMKTKLGYREPAKVEDKVMHFHFLSITLLMLVS